MPDSLRMYFLKLQSVFYINHDVVIHVASYRHSIVVEEENDEPPLFFVTGDHGVQGGRG